MFTTHSVRIASSDGEQFQCRNTTIPGIVINSSLGGLMVDQILLDY